MESAASTLGLAWLREMGKFLFVGPVYWPTVPVLMTRGTVLLPSTPGTADAWDSATSEPAQVHLTRLGYFDSVISTRPIGLGQLGTATVHLTGTTARGHPRLLQGRTKPWVMSEIHGTRVHRLSEGGRGRSPGTGPVCVVGVCVVGVCVEPSHCHGISNIPDQVPDPIPTKSLPWSVLIVVAIVIVIINPLPLDPSYIHLHYDEPCIDPPIRRGRPPTLAGRRARRRRGLEGKHGECMGLDPA